MKQHSEILYLSLHSANTLAELPDHIVCRSPSSGGELVLTRDLLVLKEVLDTQSVDLLVYGLGGGAVEAQPVTELLQECCGAGYLVQLLIVHCLPQQVPSPVHT